MEMSSRVFSFLFYLLLLTNITLINTSSNIKVLGVVELIRHGARAPLITFNEKAKNLFFGTKRSQLTINGYRQHLLLGRWIKRRYVDGDVFKLISEKDIPKQVKIMSSPVQRTIFSAAAHVMGLYPDSIIKYSFEGQSDYKTDDIPPIEGYKEDTRDGSEVKISVLDNEKDTMFRVNLCKRIGSNTLIRKEYKNDIVFFNITNYELKSAIDDVNKTYGKYFIKSHFDYKNFYKVKTLNIMLKVLRPYEYHSDMKLRLKRETLETITKAILNRLYGYRLKETKYKKLLSSHMLDTISTFFSQKINNPNSVEKFILLSAHDSNIINVFVNLFSEEFLTKKILNSVSDKKDKAFLVPPLASSLLFELIQVNGDKNYWVRIIYNGENITNGFASEIKKFGKYDLLNFQDFKNLLNSRIDSSYKMLNCSKTLE